MANIVIGADGSTTANGKSRYLSSEEDRKRFHKLRNAASAIVIGGNTARNEPYKSTPVPLIVVSRQLIINEISENPNAQIWNMDPIPAVLSAQAKFGAILIEAGPHFLSEVIGHVDELFITISDKTGDGQLVSFDGLTRNFVMEEKEGILCDVYYKFKKLK